MPSRFHPRRAPGSARTTLLIVGPLLWLVALVVVAYVTKHLNAVEYALGLLAVSVALSLVPLSAMRVARGREERDP